jgi:hypothetical protein
MDLQEAFDAGFEAVKAFVERSFDAYDARLEALERRLTELGERKDVAGLVINRDGNLVLTMSDGAVKDLGPVVGKDGNPGKDGVDGLGFDDIEAVYDGEKTITLKFTQGERVKEFAFAMPVVIDRGVYKTGETYTAGDGVTFGGSFWIAQKDTETKPEAGDDWRLSVKRGRDGKDGTVKETKPMMPLRVGAGKAE